MKPCAVFVFILELSRCKNPEGSARQSKQLTVMYAANSCYQTSDAGNNVQKALTASSLKGRLHLKSYYIVDEAANWANQTYTLPPTRRQRFSRRRRRRDARPNVNIIMRCDGGIVQIRDLKATPLFGYLRVYASLLVLYVDKGGLIVIKKDNYPLSSPPPPPVK